VRFITWNVGHQTRRKPLPEKAAAGLGRLSPDVVVLTEYVYSPSHEDFLNALAAQGLAHRCCSAYVPKQNQVLVASRHPLSAGTVACDVELSEATRPNWLHVRTDDVDVVGFRRPMFKGVPQGISRYWEWFATAISPLMAGSAVGWATSMQGPIHPRCHESRRTGGNWCRPTTAGAFAARWAASSPSTTPFCLRHFEPGPRRTSWTPTATSLRATTAATRTTRCFVSTSSGSVTARPGLRRVAPSASGPPTRVVCALG